MQGSWTLKNRTVWITHLFYLRVASGMILHYEFCWEMDVDQQLCVVVIFYFLFYGQLTDTLCLWEIFKWKKACILYILYQWTNKWRSCELSSYLAAKKTCWQSSLVILSSLLLFIKSSFYLLIIHLLFPNWSLFYNQPNAHTHTQVEWATGQVEDRQVKDIPAIISPHCPGSTATSVPATCPSCLSVFCKSKYVFSGYYCWPFCR